MNAHGRTGGLLLRTDGALHFLPAAVALRVAPPPRVTPVPGGPPDLVGVALHDGVIVAVVAIGSKRGEMVVCQHAGELVGVVGGEIMHVGSFDIVDESPDHGVVEHEGEQVPQLDVAAICARIQSSARPGRWG